LLIRIDLSPRPKLRETRPQSNDTPVRGKNVFHE
jgi:hypothetical protein